MTMLEEAEKRLHEELSAKIITGKREKGGDVDPVEEQSSKMARGESMSRESLHVLLDLTARDLDEIELRRVLESLRASSDSDEHDYQAVDIAVSADQAARVRDFSDPSWAVIENGGPIAAAT